MAIRKPTPPQAKSAAMADMLASAGQESKFKSGSIVEGTVSAVKLVCLNKVEDRFLQIITEYYEQHGVPEEEQYVPAIVIGDRYLFAGTEIIGQLLDALMAAETPEDILKAEADFPPEEDF